MSHAPLLAASPVSQVEITTGLPVTVPGKPCPAASLPASKAAEVAAVPAMNFLRLIIVYLYVIEIKTLSLTFLPTLTKCFRPEHEERQRQQNGHCVCQIGIVLGMDVFLMFKH
jgi:hypothetical protein